MNALVPDSVIRLAAEAAPRAEQLRTMPDDVVEAFRAEGLLGLLIPAAAGGRETDPASFTRTVAELATADGSAGWSVMVAATAGLMLGYVDAAVAREIAADGRGILAGVYAPGGKGVPESGGYRVSGRWPFASGCRHATWLVGGTLVPDGDGVAHRIMLIPKQDARILDTWHVAGLRGTGSDDFTVEDATIPFERTLSLAEPPVAQGALYRFPPFGLLSAGIAAAALGIARGAIADLIGIAATKKPGGAARRLAERSHAQSQIAKAEARTESSWAYLNDRIGAAWERVCSGSPVPVADRARLRLAAAHGVSAAAEAVDAMYTLGGGTSVYETGSLQRRFRDVHAATQHMMVAHPVVELAGRVLAGLDVDPSLL